MVAEKGADGRKGEDALRRLTLVLGALGFAACASPGIPPGGPLDKSAPVLLGVLPDSARTGVRPPAVIFHFDEVISERPPAATNLNQLFLISPRDGTPSVDWKRKDLTVKPSKGWRTNTTYVVTMLPGIADLHGNVRNTGAQTVFSTGGALATRSITGKIWNWLSGTGAARGYVEAIQLPDSVRYVAFSDSTGAFRVGYLPTGTFLVRAVVDENRNRGIDPREPWDSATITLTDSATVVLFAIARDSVAPVLGAITVDDSVTLRLSFESPLEPTMLPTAAEISVRASDSSAVAVTGVGLPPADTIAGPSRPPRPAPPRVLLVRLASPLMPGADYRVTVSRVTGISRTSAPAVRTFQAPVSKPASPPPVSK